MKKNPLFYERTNANSFKIAFAKRKLMLCLVCWLAVSFIATASVINPSDGKGIAKSFVISATTLMLIPCVAFVADKKGTLKDNGHEETDDEFAARAGKAETPEAFAKRFMLHSIGEALKRATDEWKKDLNDLKIKVEGVKTPEGIEELKEELRKHGLAIEALKDIRVGLDRGIKKGSIAETLAINKAKIDAFLARKSGTLEIVHKATQTSTDIADRNYYDSVWHEGGSPGQIAVRRPFLRELFRNSTAGSEFIKYRDQNTVVRDAKNVALCAASTHNTKVTWVTNTVQISKVRDFVHVCLDMMNDYNFVESEIRNLINSSVQLKIDDQLLVGTGVHPELNSLTVFASTWAANIAGTKDWTSAVASANLVDLIIVAQSQIQELGAMNKFMPNYVLLNPGDWASLMLIKNSFGDSIHYYPGLYVDSGGNIRINGMLIIPNPNIAVNEFWIGDFSKGTLYTIPGIGIEMSYENRSNFEEELVTVKAYERMNLLVRTVDTNAFMHVEDIATALSTITAP